MATVNLQGLEFHYNIISVAVSMGIQWEEIRVVEYKRSIWEILLLRGFRGALKLLNYRVHRMFSYRTFYTSNMN